MNWRSTDPVRNFSLPISFFVLSTSMAAILFAAGVARTSGAEPAGDKPIQFTNATNAAGITFTHFRGNDGIPTNLEIFGPGVCVADFDGDGYQDIYFVNGRDLHDKGIVTATPSTATTAMAPSPTSPRKPAFPAPATAWAASGATTTTTAFPISSSLNTAAMSSITTMAMALSPT